MSCPSTNETTKASKSESERTISSPAASLGTRWSFTCTGRPRRVTPSCTWKRDGRRCMPVGSESSARTMRASVPSSGALGLSKRPQVPHSSWSSRVGMPHCEHLPVGLGSLALLLLLAEVVAANRGADGAGHADAGHHALEPREAREVVELRLPRQVAHHQGQGLRRGLVGEGQGDVGLRRLEGDELHQVGREAKVVELLGGDEAGLRLLGDEVQEVGLRHQPLRHQAVGERLLGGQLGEELIDGELLQQPPLDQRSHQLPWFHGGEHMRGCAAGRDESAGEPLMVGGSQRGVRASPPPRAACLPGPRSASGRGSAGCA